MGNRYSYVGNNPLLFTDPSGHCYTDSGSWIPDGTDGPCSFPTSPPPPPTHDDAGDVCENWDIEICKDDPNNLPSDSTVDAVVDVAVDILLGEVYDYQIDYKTLRYNITALLIAAYQYGLCPEEIAYLLATALGESRFGGIWDGPHKDSMRERISEEEANDKYWYDTWTANQLGNKVKDHAFFYRGRGFVQLTGWTNYYKMGQQFDASYGVDILNNPDVVAENVQLAADIAAWGMQDGAFSGYSFEDAWDDTRQGGDFYINARRIINSLNHAKGYKDRALKFMD